MILIIGLTAFAQEEDNLPDREDLVQKIIGTDHVAGTRELLDFFQLGGVRTIFRSLDKMDLERARQYARAFRGLDLFRFRNDLNAGLQNATNNELKGLNLQLMASFGRNLEPSVFLPFSDDEKQDITLRLAAGSGLIKIQNIEYYEKFLEIAKNAEVDPATGRNDFRYADLDSSNQGFYYFSLSKLSGDTPPHHGHILSCLMACDQQSAELYTKVLDLKRKKYIPLMIDRAIRLGGVALLEAMKSHKTMKKMIPDLEKAAAAAAVVASYKDKLAPVHKPSELPVGPLLSVQFQGIGSAQGTAGAYVIVRVDSAGTVSVVEVLTPFGGSAETITTALAGMTTVPAMLQWTAVESHLLLVSP
jgi:hypothetical protein